MKITGVKIGEYGSDNGLGNSGYIEPDVKNPQWILWWDENGNGLLYTKRAATGAVEGDPIRLQA